MNKLIEKDDDGITLWYRDYRIIQDSSGNFTYSYEHVDYDGAPDAYDTRCGDGNDLDEIVAEIDEIEDVYLSDISRDMEIYGRW